MQRWFTADLHIGHARINELAGRPFEVNADEILIQNWNERVSWDDEVFILGDLFLGSWADSLEKCARLRGTKFLFPGNHDRCWIGNVSGGSVAALTKATEKVRMWARRYEAAGIHVQRECTSIRLENGMVVDLCHFPYEGDSHDGDRFTEHRPKDLGRVLLHGHVHEKWKVCGRQINVGVDAWDYAPVSEQTLAVLVAIIESSPKDSAKIG